MPKNIDYCIAIRTLGKAGAKYQKLLDSISSQTVQPIKVLVYIPYGCELPKERLGWETFVRCQKGMVAQRSLPFDEVVEEYCLFCDDDISFPCDFVATLFKELYENHGDCISPDVYHTHEESFLSRNISRIMWASPRRPDDWAFVVNKYTSGFSYNRNPGKKTLCSQSAAFACFLCKMKTFKTINFEDEKWVDTIPYSAGDDQLFYYKMYLMGYRLLVCYNTGIIHHDAKSSRTGDEKMQFKQSVFMRFCLWYRTCYKLKRNNKTDKLICIVRFGCKIVSIFFYQIVWSILRGRFFRLTAYIRGLREGYQYVHSDEYNNYPLYDFRIICKMNS